MYDSRLTEIRPGDDSRFRRNRRLARPAPGWENGPVADPAVALGRRRSASASWSRAAAYDRTHPQAADAVLAAGLAVLTGPYVVLHTAGGVAVWLCDAGLVLPLVWRRRYPEAVFAVLAAVALVQWVIAEPLASDVSLLVALFTVALQRPRRVAAAAGAVLEVGVVLASTRWNLAGSWDRSLIGLSGLAGVALLLGAALRERRAHLRELTERAARLESERDQQALIAAAAERTRIAREMHDVIAHSLAVIVTMADGAAAKLNRDPQQAGAAISSIAQVGRQALSDTRRLLGVLRDQVPDAGSPAPADLAPQPGLAELDGLMAQLRATGLDATVSYTGTMFPLAPGAQLTVYRLVQEAATNTLKHAPGATMVRVHVRWQEPTVEVRVIDNGPPPSTSPAPRPPVPTGGGHGIAGMRERVALYGGRVETGSLPGGGWVVRASFDANGGGRHGR